jgi:Rps23 Pro-64 3,4-dihydroxylase Tpa1-like proline 4-hydroxylase
MFGSKYSEGCFLSPHHDVNLGSIGFVLQLTKDWKPQCGGVLHFLNDDLTKIDISETPTFNTLTLFHLPEGEGKWHYVSHVNPGVKSNRIAYSGWYN